MSEQCSSSALLTVFEAVQWRLAFVLSKRVSLCLRAKKKIKIFIFKN